MTDPHQISDVDRHNLLSIRRNVARFLHEEGTIWGDAPGLLLDIAPQVHEGARPYFSTAVTIETLDIDRASAATYHADLCATNAFISGSRYDIIVCTEVLEHVLNPFSAIAEIARLLKPGGRLLATSPFDLRIHGPLPDCWRFTEHGWRALLQGFDNIRIQSLDNPERFLMPLHYAVSANKA
jgi:SAM-dependent methyltransferase